MRDTFCNMLRVENLYFEMQALKPVGSHYGSKNFPFEKDG